MNQFLRILAASAACAGLLSAQTDAHKGRIQGAVLDPQGAAVAGASVTVTETGTGIARSIQTNESGRFQAVALNPGVYAIDAQSEGFAPSVVEGIVVTVGSAAQIDIGLRLEASVTLVEVSASPLDGARREELDDYVAHRKLQIGDAEP